MLVGMVMECDGDDYSSRCMVIAVVTMVIAVLECFGSGGLSSTLIARRTSFHKHDSLALVRVFRYVVDR